MTGPAHRRGRVRAFRDGSQTFHRRRTEIRHDLKRTLAATPSRKINNCVKKSKQNQLLTYYLFFNQIPKELTTLRTSAPREVVFQQSYPLFQWIDWIIVRLRSSLTIF